MYPVTIDKDFYCTSASWHTVTHKIQSREFRNLLSEHLRISDYSEQVKQYQFLFVAVQPTNRNHDNWRAYFSSKRGILYHNLKLDFERFQQADQEEAYQMQAQLYLQSILEIPTLRGMKKVAFDYQKFYDHAQNLFLKKGWLKTENQMI